MTSTVAARPRNENCVVSRSPLHAPRPQRRDLPDDDAVVDVEEGAGEHPGGGDQVVGEANAGEAERVVQEGEGEDGREAKEEDHPAPLAADRLVDAREARIAAEAPLHRLPRQVAGDEEGGRRPEEGPEEGVEGSARQPEEGARGERQQRSRHEGDGAHEIDGDEREGSPEPQPLHPREEAREVLSGQAAHQEHDPQPQHQQPSGPPPPAHPLPPGPPRTAAIGSMDVPSLG